MYEIKSIVNEVVSDQLFLRSLIQQLSLENCIQKELNIKLPTHEKNIKNKVKTYVHDLINNRLSDFQRDTIPSQVAKELTNQITTFLANNVQITQIVDYHTAQLNAVLTDTARKTLAELVDEPQYHLTTTAHLNAMDTKCDIKILEIQNVLNQQLSNNYQAFTEQLNTLKNINNKELSELKETLHNVNEFEKEFSNYKVITSFNDKSIKYLNDKIVNTQWLLGIAFITGAISYYVKFR